MKAKFITKYRVVDNPFNRANHPDLIGRTYFYPPSYVVVEPFRTCY